MYSLSRVLVLVWIACVAFKSGVEAVKQRLAPFRRIQICEPISILISPSRDSQLYQVEMLSVNAGQGALMETGEVNEVDDTPFRVFAFEVLEETLYVSTTTQYMTFSGLSLTITMPYDALEAVYKAESANLKLAPGFEFTRGTLNVSLLTGDGYRTLPLYNVHAFPNIVVDTLNIR